MNQAFRIRNIDLICKFRYFIILLHNQLKKLWIDQQGKQLTTFYRGQFIGKTDLKTLQTNVGRLISINTIMSITCDSEVARIFVNDETREKFIFQINLTNAEKNILYSFADISQFSSISDEKEVLVFTGAVFRIHSVEKENDLT